MAAHDSFMDPLVGATRPRRAIRRWTAAFAERRAEVAERERQEEAERRGDPGGTELVESFLDKHGRAARPSALPILRADGNGAMANLELSVSEHACARRGRGCH